MEAFSLWPITIYRYGIFYAVTFLICYGALAAIGKYNLIPSVPQLRALFTTHLDNLLLMIFLWVIVGWRLGFMLFWDGWDLWPIAKRQDVWKIHEWWMAFVWWVVWVALTVTLYLARHLRYPPHVRRIVIDLIVAIIPFWVMIGRYANFLNQEIIGIPVSNVPTWLASFLESTNMTHVYSSRDSIERVNINYLEAIGEWAIILIILQFVFWKFYRKAPRAGLLTWLFLILYGSIRFVLEFLKQYHNSYDSRWARSIAQWFMLAFVVIGIIYIITIPSLSNNWQNQNQPV